MPDNITAIHHNNNLFLIIKNLLPSRKILKAIGITTGTGLPLILMLSWHLLQLENHKEMADYQQRVYHITSTIDQKLRSDENILLSSSFFLNVEKDVSPDIFTQFITPYLVFSTEVDSVSWIPYITDAALTDFRNKARHFFPDYEVQEFGKSNAEALASGHFPVYFQHPLRDLTGLDFASLPNVRDAILRSKKENAIILLKPSIRQVIGSTRETAQKSPVVVDLFYPVYHNSTKFSGVINMTIDLDDVVTAISSDNSVNDLTIKLRKESVDHPNSGNDNNKSEAGLINHIEKYCQLTDRQVIF